MSGLSHSGKSDVTTSIVRHDLKQLATGRRAVCGEQSSWPVSDLHCRVENQAFGDIPRMVSSLRYDRIALD
jgi:hypothetical protein